MKIYIANNDGGWLDRHDSRRDISETDWWHSPKATMFRKAATGDLFFVTRTGSNELFAWARVKQNYAEEAAESAWLHTFEAYSMDLTYQERAAGVLDMRPEQATGESKVGLIALRDLTWFPDHQRPPIPDDYRKRFNRTGAQFKIKSDAGYKYFSELAEETIGNEAIRNSYSRVTQAQLAEILPRHIELADRFVKWLEVSYQNVQRERRRVDIRFSQGNCSLMAELKICYDLNTRQAIREAIGQVLEYNHYPGRTPTDEWWIVLDQEPAPEDKAYIEELREQHAVPLYLGYESSPKSANFTVLKS
jgi:hypothetical protein